MKNFIAFFGLLILLGCRSTDPDIINRGNDSPNRPGHPEIYTEAIALIDGEDRPYLDVILEINNRSLIRRTYETTGSQFRFHVMIEVYSVDNRTVTLLNQVEFIDSILLDPENIFDTGDPYVTSRQIMLPEQNQQLEVWIQVTDLHSGLETVRQNVTTVVMPDSDVAGISSIRMLGMRSADSLRFRSFPSYVITSDVDSLKFTFQVVRPENVSSSEIQLRMFRFPADEDIARHLSDTFPGIGTLWYRGIEYQRPELLFSIDRNLETETGPITIEYLTELLKPGNYRFEVAFMPDSGNNSEIIKAREFRITPSLSFPAVETVFDLRAPLQYLMTTREFNRLMEINDPNELKLAMDAFWLDNISNPQRARQVIELYYNRVEQANLQFSNFKDGWKTDMGFIYILFGPPLYVDRSLDRMVWRYSHSDVERVSNFTFVRPKLNDQFFPFNHYVLQRRSDYHSVQYNRIQSWLSSHILQLQ